MPIQWPLTVIRNEFGIATLSLGDWRSHKLRPRLEEAAKAGFKFIDLFDECWAAYLVENGLDGEKLWEPTPDNLRVASSLGDLVKSLGMEIACTQPLRKIEGILGPVERQENFDLVAKRFPFMRAFDTDLVFMCSSIRTDKGVTSDLKTVAKDLAELGRMAEEFSIRHGGRMLKIGYEGLSWAVRNTWSSSWEVVRLANRLNVGLVVDAFNVLAVEFADPYNVSGHGRFHETLEDSLKGPALLDGSASLRFLERRYSFSNAEMHNGWDPRTFLPPSNSEVPALLPWSRRHRLYPFERELGGYMPTELVTAGVLATGYTGPISLEVFNASLHDQSPDVPSIHAKRGITG